MPHVLLIDKDVLQMELDASNRLPYVQLTRELKLHAKHSQEVQMVFAIT